MLRPPRDHDIVEDSSGRFYVVVGSLHPPGKLIAYLKYIPTYAETQWARGDRRYDRILKAYGVRSLHRYLREHQEFSYDPVFDAYVPTVNTSSVFRYYYPEVRFQELLSRADDELEAVVVEFADMLRSRASISASCLGVTGSLLTKTHNVRTSDVDIVIYGCRSALDFIACLEDFTKLRSTSIDLARQAEAYGLDSDTLARINPPYKKLLVRGREVNVLFVDDSPPPRYGSAAYVNLGPVEVVADVVGGDCRALMYPSVAPVDKVIALTLGRYGVDVVRGIRYVASYEGLYSYLLFLGGRLRVRGVLQRVIPDGSYRVVVGGIEEPGYVVPEGPEPGLTTFPALRRV